jgi:hypothetical protein
MNRVLVLNFVRVEWKTDEDYIFCVYIVMIDEYLNIE